MMAVRWLLVTLVLVSPAGNAADTLGRLFYTPAERARLDDRQRTAPSTRVDAAAALHYSGYVARQGGPTTLWVDGQALRSDDAGLRARHLAPLPDGRLRLAAPGAPPVRLRVGESVIDREVVAAYRIERPAIEAEAAADASSPAAPRRLRRRNVDARDAGEAP